MDMLLRYSDSTASPRLYISLIDNIASIVLFNPARSRWMTLSAAQRKFENPCLAQERHTQDLLMMMLMTIENAEMIEFAKPIQNLSWRKQATILAPFEVSSPSSNLSHWDLLGWNPAFFSAWNLLILLAFHDLIPSRTFLSFLSRKALLFSPLSTDRHKPEKSRLHCWYVLMACSFLDILTLLKSLSSCTDFKITDPQIQTNRSECDFGAPRQK